MQIVPYLLLTAFAGMAMIMVTTRNFSRKQFVRGEMAGENEREGRCLDLRLILPPC